MKSDATLKDDMARRKRNVREAAMSPSEYSRICRESVAGRRTRVAPDLAKRMVNSSRCFSDVHEILQLLENVQLTREDTKLLMIISLSRFRIFRDDAYKFLGRSNHMRKDVAKCLSVGLRDPWWVARCSAIWSLAKQGAKEWTKSIIERYNSWSPIEKKWVLFALGEMKDAEAVDFLVRTFTHARSKEFKYHAAGSLACLGVHKFEEYIRARLEDERDPELLLLLEDSLACKAELSSLAPAKVMKGGDGVR